MIVAWDSTCRRVTVSVAVELGTKRHCGYLMYLLWPVVGEVLAEIGVSGELWRVLMDELLQQENRAWGD
jgi:hypothetical protein